MKWIICLFLFFAGFQSYCPLIASETPEDFSFSEDLNLDDEIVAFLEDEAEEELISAKTAAKSPVQLPSAEKGDSRRKVKQHVEKMEVQEIDAPSLAVELDKLAAEDEKMIVHSTTPLDVIREETAKSVRTIEINLKQVFAGSPIIYTLLFLLSTTSICIWLYCIFTIRSFEFLPPGLVKQLRAKLISNQFDEALDLCVKEKHFFCKMLASGILVRKHGLNAVIDTMKSEGKRSTISFWQRINVLNEIAIIAPMLGLLGTVLGMFYAFYDLNRSVESVSLLFDGLGISVGTTVAGLIVAIVAMILYSLAKYRLVKVLANVENEIQTFATLIDVQEERPLETISGRSL
jgi:biopolymer transport protein ExbB